MIATRILSFLKLCWETFLREQPQWILWTPVWIGIGIGIYFSLSTEPSFWISGLFILKPLLLAYFLYRFEALRPFLIATCLIAFGFGMSHLRTWIVDTPQLTQSLEPVSLEGSVEEVEKKVDRWVVTLRDVFSQEKLPLLNRIRFNLRGDKQLSQALKPGDRLRVKIVLRPPSLPPTPEVYDFRRKAYFNGLSAVGYATEPPQILSSSLPWISCLQKWRHDITETIREKIKGQAGAIAAALVTGDRSGIRSETRQAFADAGIAHILAISGLHLAIVAGFVFFLIRRGLCFIPFLAVRWPTKKIAACAALILTSVYLSLCWQSLPARRAFLMTALALGAVLIDRTAISLRNVLLAATLILICLPESLLNPSFQLSFAAVIALIAAYESLQTPFRLWKSKGGVIRQIMGYFLSIMGTTLIATTATTPYTLFTFNQLTLHAVWSNLAAIPLTVFWIMPLEVLNLLFLPVSLDFLTFPLLEKGIQGLIWIAVHISKWPYGVLYFPQASISALVLMTLGGLWVCLWKRPWRWAGIVPILISSYLFFSAKPPLLYIDRTGQLLGIVEGETLYLSSLRKNGYTASLWQRHSGNLQLRPLTHHPTLSCHQGVCQGNLKGQSVRILLPYASPSLSCLQDSLHINLRDAKKCRNARYSLTLADLQEQGGRIFQNELSDLAEVSFPKRPWSG